MNSPNRGFSLVELLVAMGIMGMLAVAASSGYHAVVRGMTERGVTTAVSSAMRSAHERAQIDRVSTAIYCYNRMLNKVDDEHRYEKVSTVVGVLVAVRRSGRITAKVGDMLYDEFADLDRSYKSNSDTSDIKKRAGIRLYKFNGDAAKMQYSLVSDIAYLNKSTRVYLPSLEMTTNLWAAAFQVKTDVSVPNSPTWKVADGYGFEFMEMQLPNGFIFGTDIPQDESRISILDTVLFEPVQPGNRGTSQTIKISRLEMDASGNPRARPVGTAKLDNSLL